MAVFFGNAADVRKAWNIIKDFGFYLGLQVNLSKCEPIPSYNNVFKSLSRFRTELVKIADENTTILR